MLVLSNHKKGSGLPWTLEFHFIPQPKAETAVHYQHLQWSHRINCINCNQKCAVTLIYIWFCPWIQPEQIEAPVRQKPREKKKKKNNQHLQGAELCLPWRKEVGELLCGLDSATLNSRLSNSRITWTQNHLVWLLALAGLYHDNVVRVKSGSRSQKAAETVLALFREQVQ